MYVTDGDFDGKKESGGRTLQLGRREELLQYHLSHLRLNPASLNDVLDQGKTLEFVLDDFTVIRVGRPHSLDFVLVYGTEIEPHPDCSYRSLVMDGDSRFYMQAGSNGMLARFGRWMKSKMGFDHSPVVDRDLTDAWSTDDRTVKPGQLFFGYYDPRKKKWDALTLDTNRVRRACISQAREKAGFFYL